MSPAEGLLHTGPLAQPGNSDTDRKMGPILLPKLLKLKVTHVSLQVSESSEQEDSSVYVCRLVEFSLKDWMLKCSHQPYRKTQLYLSTKLAFWEIQLSGCDKPEKRPDPSSWGHLCGLIIFAVKTLN